MHCLEFWVGCCLGLLPRTGDTWRNLTCHHSPNLPATCLPAHLGLFCACLHPQFSGWWWWWWEHFCEALSPPLLSPGSWERASYNYSLFHSLSHHPHPIPHIHRHSELGREQNFLNFPHSCCFPVVFFPLLSKVGSGEGVCWGGGGRTGQARAGEEKERGRGGWQGKRQAGREARQWEISFSLSFLSNFTSYWKLVVCLTFLESVTVTVTTFSRQGRLF